MPRIFVIILILASMSIMACKSKKDTTKGGTTATHTTLSKALKNNFLPETLAIQGKAKAEFGKTNLGFSYRVNIAKDSLIWIKATKFIEGMRVLITTDSVYVLNRLERTYTAAGYDVVKEFVGLDADFGLIQDMLLGNFHPIPEVKNMQLADKKGNPLQFSGEAGDYRFQYDIKSPEDRLVAMRANHLTKDEFMSLLYTAFETIDNRMSFAVKGNLSVGIPDTANVSFEHTKMEVNPEKITFSFSVPSSYTRTKK